MKQKTRVSQGLARVSCTSLDGVKHYIGGEGGIRTHGRLTPTPDFESGTFDHSATSPWVRILPAMPINQAECSHVQACAFIICPVCVAGYPLTRRMHTCRYIQETTQETVAGGIGGYRGAR